MDIEQLLKKFYDGVSTPEEEQLLKAFFLEEEHIDDRWKADQWLFKALYEDMQMPEGVSERLEKVIEQMDKPHPVTNRKKRFFLFRISGVAAVILLCIGLFFTKYRSVESQMADTFDDPVEAALAAEKAIAFMSTHLNKGINQVSEAGQEIEKVNQVLEKLKSIESGKLKVEN